MGIRILVADDHAMVRAGFCSNLEQQPDMQVVGEAEDGRTAVRLARELSPDVIVLDVTMPLLSGIEATRRIVAEHPQARIIMLSVHRDRPVVAEALNAGAAAYLLKNSTPDELILAVRAVQRGETYLSPRIIQMILSTSVVDSAGSASSAFASLTAKEREVLQLLAEGKSNKEVAACLCVGVKAVEARRAQIMEKLHIHTVAGLTKYAVREGLTSLDI